MTTREYELLKQSQADIMAEIERLKDAITQSQAAKNARIELLETENARLRAELDAMRQRHPLQVAEDAVNALRNL